ncbi:hypothetical protein HELRODRAFT_162718 [Helobdella robusta]|uniref:Uncharacterized protein n=1 Tax=Helobdella robusta TaxID=6412 RepID=T1ET16_HELRO|nr:hypothetical protein HELRODRAFT_162718 [Helobdella robusta]ESN99207.1 hypothetical protein HELRODRAFT_162718 [Helobdella robusta]
MASLQKINLDSIEPYPENETNISPQEQILNNYVISMLKDTAFERSSVRVFCRPFNVDEQIRYLMQMFNPSLITNMHQNTYLNDETSVQLLDSFFVFGEHAGTSTPLSNSTKHNTSNIFGGTPATSSHLDMNKNKADVQHQDSNNKTTDFVIDQPVATTVASLYLADKEVNVFTTSATMQNECRSNGSPHLPSIR